MHCISLGQGRGDMDATRSPRGGAACGRRPTALMHSILLERVAAVAALEVDAQRDPTARPAPSPCESIGRSCRWKFAKAVCKIASTFRTWVQEPGLPLVVSASMQMAPPAVTWPVYQQKRGDTQRRKNGRVG